MFLKHLFALFVCLFCAALSSGLKAQEKDTVVLQLKWEHEFQFAGYYAAKWQGFYERQGLDVEIRSATTPDGDFISPSEELLKGNADFAIGGLDLLIERGQGEHLVVLSPIYQNSPIAAFSLASVPIDTPEQLSRLRIAAVSNDYLRTQIEAMFLTFGIDPAGVDFVDEDITVETLLEGRADVIVTYDASAQYRASELGVTLNTLHPRDYGINFYGDVLYTTEEVIARDPDMVNRFVRASLDGWRYAQGNRVDLANRIAAELPRYKYLYDDVYAYNRFFAEHIDEYLLYPIVPLGHNQLARWQSAYFLLLQQGLIDQPFAVEDLLKLPVSANVSRERSLQWVLVVLSALAMLLIVVLARRSPHRLLLLTPFIFFGVQQLMEIRFRVTLADEQRLHVVEQLSTVRYQLESRLSNQLSLINGLAAFIASNPDFTQEEFDTYAQTVIEREPTLINLAAAPNLVIRYIYPLVGNEAALGLDYRVNANQSLSVQRTVQTEAMVVAGPLNLVQGGSAFVGRAPVFTRDANGVRRLWGIVSAPIATASIYGDSQLFDPSTGLEIAIRGRDGLGADGEVFFGAAEVFSHAGVVTMPVELGDGSWQLGAYSLQDISEGNPGILLLRGLATILCALAMIGIFLRSRSKEKEEAYEQLIFRNEQFLREVETVSRVGGWRLDANGVFTEVSEQCMQIFGVSAGGGVLTLEQVCEQFTQETAKSLRILLERGPQRHQGFDTELRLERPGKGELWLHIRGEMISLPNGSRELVGAMQDVTKAKEADQLIEYQANYDALTGLANRSLLRDRLNNALAMSRRASTKLAVLFIDLDNFKSVNDNLGHDVGDEVLVEASRRICHCVREVDTVARYSGDEFIVVLRDVFSETAVWRIANDIVAVVGEPFHINTHQVHCGASLGIAFFPDDAQDAETLIIKADQAMYEVKKAGRNGWQFYTQEMQRNSERRHMLFNELMNALKHDELSVHYQPIYSLAEKRIVGCEALVRWQKPDGSFVPPDLFIPLAEESGLVIRIDHFVLKSAREFITGLNRELGLKIGLSVNVSTRLLYMRDESSQAWFHEIKQKSEMPVIVEITERVLVEDATRALEVLNDLSDAGIQISIDDFGTGYSGLSYLSRFPVTGFKIDRSFVARIGELKTEEALIETMLMMAEKLQLKVVAEGVETQEQLEFLRALKCDFAQGYHISRPVPEAGFRQLLQHSLKNGLGL
ncbi:MAG: EAL domain-containing protein [Pseudomonadales bacterium]|nr:EAL domain-containing protein [Pseudomonadales bacterium]